MKGGADERGKGAWSADRGVMTGPKDQMSDPFAGCSKGGGGGRTVEVAAGKRSWLQQQALARSDDGQLVQMLASNDFLGRTMTGYQGNIDKQVETLSPEQINTAFKKLVKADDLLIVKAGDFKKTAQAEAKPAAEPEK